MRWLPLFLLLLAGSAVAEAQVQTPPACAAVRAGMVACFGEKLCECRWEPGGSLSGQVSGHRWDCGVLRPACGVAPAGPPPQSLPYVPGWPPTDTGRRPATR